MTCQLLAPETERPNSGVSSSTPFSEHAQWGPGSVSSLQSWEIERGTHGNLRGDGAVPRPAARPRFSAAGSRPPSPLPPSPYRWA